MGRDSIWIGNIGRYNEGELVGDWLELPFDPGTLETFLAERCGVDPLHEEVMVMDANLEGPLGAVGYRAGEYEDLEILNALAEILDTKSDFDLSAIRAYAEASFGNLDDPLEYANAALQSDSISYFSLPQAASGISDEHRYGMWLVDEAYGSLGHLDDETLLRYLDCQSLGEELERTDVNLDHEARIWIWQGGDGYEDGRFDADDIHEEALMLRDDAPAAGDEVAHAVEVLKDEWGIRDAADEDPRLAVDTAALLEGLGYEEAAAARLYAEYNFSNLDGALEYANLALQVDDIGYHTLPESGTPEEALGEYMIKEYGAPGREDVEGHFDFEAYGRDRSGDVVFTDSGFLEPGLCEVDADLYTRSEVLEAAELLRDDRASSREPLSSLDALERSVEAGSAALAGRSDRQAIGKEER